MQIYKTDWNKTKVSTYEMIPNQDVLLNIKENEIQSIKDDERVLRQNRFYNRDVYSEYVNNYNYKIVSKPDWKNTTTLGILYEKMIDAKSDLIREYLNGDYQIDIFKETRRNNSKKPLFLISEQGDPYGRYIQATKTLYILELIERGRILYSGKTVLGSKEEVLKNKQLLLESIKELYTVLSAYTIEKTGEMSFTDARKISSPFHYELSCDDYMYMTPLTDKILELKNIHQ